MSSQHKALLHFSGDNHLSYLEQPRFKCGADHHPVLLFIQQVALVLGHAQAPIALVIFKHKWNQVWVMGMHMQVSKQVIPADDTLKGQRIGHHMQGMVSMIDDATAIDGF